MPCPFAQKEDAKCEKKGGVCSIRLYQREGDQCAKTVDGEEGTIVSLCPNRFQQNGIIYQEVSKSLIETDKPRVLGEVPFLKKPGSSIDSKEGVGNIDNVLVNDVAKKWCALEVQAVYFSGKKFKLLFEHIRDFNKTCIPFPERRRGPDWRSSGSKRLLPQLQTKVPILSRWGVKMAVVVDTLWYENNIGVVPSVPHLSNSEIVWFVFDYELSKKHYQLRLKATHMHELDATRSALIGGIPVSLDEFRKKIGL